MRPFINFGRMKAAASFFLLLLTILPSFAQPGTELTWSEEFEFGKNAGHNEVIGVKDDKIYITTSSGDLPQASTEVSLCIYNAGNLGFIQRTGIINNKSDHSFEKVLITTSGVIVFTSYYDRQLAIKILAAARYDETGNVLQESRRVDEMPSDFKNDESSFRICASPDGSKILICHDNKLESGESKNFELKLMDQSFNVLWKKDISLPYKDKMVEFIQWLVDDAGNAYLLSSINPYGIKAQGLGNLMNMKSTIFNYRPSQDKLLEYEFALTRNWINEVRMVFDREQNLTATAFFTYPNDYKIRGFVFFQIDVASGGVRARKMLTLEKQDFAKVDEVIARLREYSRMIVGSPGIYPGSSSHMSSTSSEFLIKDIGIEGDMVVIAAEAFRRDERCSESFSDQQMIVDCQKNFLYGDIMLFFLSTDCELKAVRIVPKIQHCLNRLNPYYSFSMAGNREKIVVMYNEDIRNRDLSSGEEKIPLHNLNKAVLSISAFTREGQSFQFSPQIRAKAEPLFTLPETLTWACRASCSIRRMKKTISLASS